MTKFAVQNNHSFITFDRYTTLENEVRSEFLFPRVDGAKQKRIPTSYIRQLPYGFHDFRKCFRTIADTLDISAIVAARLVNHASAETVDAGYIDTDIARLARGAQMVADEIDRLAGNSEQSQVVDLPVAVGAQD